jgi:serine/threonine-protein kinase
MKGKTPLLTLLVGLLTAIALVIAGMNATSKDAARKKARAAADTAPATTPAATPTSAAPVAPATSAPPLDQTKATYAGRVAGAGGTIAIAVHDGTAIAYLCDGRRIEAWLQGTANAGALTMTGANNASLTGTFGADKAGGTVSAAGRQWTFEVPAVTAPSGLYRAAANVAGAQVIGGWIVLADGTQVGVLNTAGEPRPAPELNTSTGKTVVGDTTLTATPINGTTGSGF